MACKPSDKVVVESKFSKEKNQVNRTRDLKRGMCCVSSKEKHRWSTRYCPKGRFSWLLSVQRQVCGVRQETRRNQTPPTFALPQSNEKKRCEWMNLLLFTIKSQNERNGDLPIYIYKKSKQSKSNTIPPCPVRNAVPTLTLPLHRLTFIPFVSFKLVRHQSIYTVLLFPNPLPTPLLKASPSHYHHHQPSQHSQPLS